MREHFSILVVIRTVIIQSFAGVDVEINRKNYISINGAFTRLT